jgi:hypothetical protein
MEWAGIEGSQNKAGGCQSYMEYKIKPKATRKKVDYAKQNGKQSKADHKAQ